MSINICPRVKRANARNLTQKLVHLTSHATLEKREIFVKNTRVLMDESSPILSTRWPTPYLNEILGVTGNSRQFEHLQNYTDLRRKPLERDWRTKRLLSTQTLPISDVHKNSFLNDINLKLCL